MKTKPVYQYFIGVINNGIWIMEPTGITELSIF